jgi:hypothetical protein
VTGATIELLDLPGGQVTVEGILQQSIFRVRTTTPTHETTISALLAVADEDVTNAIVEVVPPQLIADAYDTSRRLDRESGVIVSRLRDIADGAPMAGIAGDAFTIGETTVFLDGEGAVSGDAPASTASGVALLLNVPAGLVELESALPEHYFDAPLARVESSGVTLVNIDVGLDPPPIPTNVSFENDVMPIFDDRYAAEQAELRGPARRASDRLRQPLRSGLSDPARVDHRRRPALARSSWGQPSPPSAYTVVGWDSSHHQKCNPSY